MKKVYLFALIFAVLTGLAVYTFTRDLQKSSREDTMGVVVATRQIPQRTLITSDMVDFQQLPVVAVNPRAMTELSDVVGKIAQVTIEIDEQVLSAKITERDIEDAGLAYSIPDGRRAISIEVNETSGVAGYLQEGDRVDVVAAVTIDSMDTTTREDIPAGKMVLQNIEVLVVSTQPLNEKEESSQYTIVTLAVTPEEAVKLFFVTVNGRISLVLRGDQDSDIVEIPIYYDIAQ